MDREIFGDELRLFRESFRNFLAKEVEPHYLKWDRAGAVPREVFALAGQQGFLGLEVPQEYGGAGVSDFRFNVVIGEEICRAGVIGFGAGLTLHNDICVPYLMRYASEEQRRRWLPGVVDGSFLTAIAMTEPDAGSDLAAIATRARREGDHYVVNGTKTFITNGLNSDLVITVVRTDPDGERRDLTLLVAEAGTEGFERGRNLEKLGMHAQDTAELFFADARIPVANLLGEEGRGFHYLTANLPQERVSIAIAAVASSQAALDWTIEYVRERRAFGRTIASFQHTRFELAEMTTAVTVARAFLDRCIERLDAGVLSSEEAAMAKWWCTDLQGDVTDRCLQLHGGYGYMTEYPIARAYADARVTRIYGGTNEIMKEIVGRGLEL
jgi:alkylation response protein AidB-like acyl-CoA dehydrogenase